MKLNRHGAISIVFALTIILAACGSDSTSSPAGSAAPAGSSETGALNDADVEFAQGMIGHHEQAIEMAEIALDPTIGASPEVIDLATRIKGAQDPEVQLMTGWLTAAGKPVTMDTEDHDMSTMDGMMTAEEMDSIAGMTGADFDQSWLTMMIEHHEGAISQSQTVKADGSDPATLALADTIITAQQAEITEMKALLN
jgi:uncharacterized protein (DUF305 family)